MKSLLLQSSIFASSILFTACVTGAEDPTTVESFDDDTVAADGKADAVAPVYVRITGTCFQTYNLIAVNTGASLGASDLVFDPGEESKEGFFCAGTNRALLRGSKQANGVFAVHDVWLQESGSPVGNDAEFVRALELSDGRTFERSVNTTPIRPVALAFGTLDLSARAEDQFTRGRIVLASPRTTTGRRSVAAVFTEME